MCMLEDGHSWLSYSKSRKYTADGRKRGGGGGGGGDDEVKDTETEIPVQPVFTFNSRGAHDIYLATQITAQTKEDVADLLLVHKEIMG